MLRIWVQYPPQPHGSTGEPGGEKTGAAAPGEFPNMPPKAFVFLTKSSCSILLLHTRKGLCSCTAHISSYTGTVCVRAQHSPALNSPQPAPKVQCVYHTLFLFPSQQPQATGSLSVLVKPPLAGEGAINSALSQESCGRPCGCGPGAAVALVPTLVPGTFLS